MSYINGTTNYDLPQYVGSDVPDWTDTNEPFAALDAAVGGATSGVTALGTRMTTAEGNITQLQTDVVTAQTTADGAVSGLATASEAITLLQNTVSSQGAILETKFNSVAIADAYSGSSTYSVGDVVTYNGNRYVCKTAVTTGEPFDADKWDAEDVETVLSDLNSNITNLVKTYTYTGTSDSDGNIDIPSTDLTYSDGIILSATCLSGNVMAIPYPRSAGGGVSVHCMTYGGAVPQQISRTIEIYYI